MEAQVVKFNTKDKPEFYKELRKRVNDYFSDNSISRHANLNMIFKTVFMISLYFIPFILMLTGVVTSNWAVLVMWCVMGFGMSGIGLSIMHDANHGAYSRNQKVNNFVGFILNFIGGYHMNWRIQHNVLHHTFTNIEGHDEDINKGIMRFTPNQKRRGIFRFQIFYAPLLYGILTLYWVTVKDFEQLVRYSRRNLLVGQGISFKSTLVRVILYKIAYYAVTLVLPILIMDVPWWIVVLGFVSMHFICGMILALIFQAAHVLENTEFHVVDEHGGVENTWAVHQMKTTSNFANSSSLFSWFIGGLNYQIEHHLFPNVCHVHYRNISVIVREVAREYDVPYNEYKTFYGALKSHFTLLNQLGTGKYDRLHPAT